MYNHKEIEAKWQKYWEENGLFRAENDSDKPKYYALDMFPYPSGAGLHVGHPEGYTATDIISRYKRMRGYNVLHPMGWDSFGLPAENYAIKMGTPPKETTERNIQTFTKQIKALGFSYDWEREITTSSPEYYKWTQWFFLFLYKKGLAYKKNAPVNWCNGCQTVLANEQVVDNQCERCQTEVVQKKMSQWFFKITDFIEDKFIETKRFKRVVFLHGLNGEPPEFMRADFELAGYNLKMPKLPNASLPKWEAWAGELDKLNLDQETVVIGHSLGGTLITRWLESRRKKVGKVILIATPFSDVNLPEIKDITRQLITKEIAGLAEFSIWQSNDDPLVPLNEGDKYAEILGVKPQLFSARGHFEDVTAKELIVELKKTKVSGLISGLDKIDWPNSTKVSQKNWIGKSEGANVKFKVQSSKFKVEVFTTRPDTLFGATYMVLAPEHPLVEKITTEEQKKAVENYLIKTQKKSDLERTDLNKDKSGVFTGAYAVNPVNGKEIPIWVADYVLMGYGTGAIMAVPAHDERDNEFAKKLGLEIIEVVEGLSDPFQKSGGKMKNSEFLDGLSIDDAISKIIDWLEKKGVGERKTTYRLRDWLVSRQRYWGAPIPIIHCEKCGEVPVEEKDLPIMLPTDVDFKPTGESPLTSSKSFHQVVCPKCGAKAKRENDTMDTFVCSSWYFLRFCDPKNVKEFASKKLTSKWLPVDLYVGGAEHTVLHLLYSRFFTKALYKFGYIDFDEPFAKLRHQGMILAEDGFKMSKSLGNVINPDEIVKTYGADTLRMYEMFMGPFEQSISWSTSGVEGIYRFLQKIWKMFEEIELSECGGDDCSEAPKGLPELLHKTIKKVTEDIENFRFNTAISQMMIFVKSASKESKIPKLAGEKFIQLIAPFAPHLADELWEKIGNKGTAMESNWPDYIEALTIDSEIELVIQVNGKVRSRLNVSKDISKEEALKQAKALEKIQGYLEGKKLVKEIFVPGKLVNLVIR